MPGCLGIDFRVVPAWWIGAEPEIDHHATLPDEGGHVVVPESGTDV